MDTMSAVLEFAVAYLDDILIKRENDESRKEHIKAVFQKIDVYGFNLGSEKCKFSMKQIKYLGKIIDKNGRRPDPERAETIKNVPVPNNVTNIQAFLDLANYYSIYIPKIYGLRAHLNNLLKKGAKWNWLEEYEEAFQKIKSCLQSDLSPAHFDARLAWNSRDIRC